VQHFETAIYFRCPKCHVANYISVEVPQFDFNVDRTRDLTSEGPIFFECPNCEWEFDGQAVCSYAGCEVTLSGFDDLRFTGDTPMFSPEEDDFWSGYEPPENPYEIFTETHSEMMELAEVEIRVSDPQLIFRMIFSQIIAAAEAYLADTLIRNVVGHSEATRKLLGQDRHINQEKFTLSQLADNAEFLQDTIRSYLRSILYHNIDRVRALFRFSLDIEIKTSDEDWVFLLEAIQYRHDCVHRNGYSAEGHRLTVFTREYIQQTGVVASRLVSSIEERVNPPPF
jgi:hypothetical protein